MDHHPNRTRAARRHSDPHLDALRDANAAAEFDEDPDAHTDAEASRPAYSDGYGLGQSHAAADSDAGATG
ncbi:MAG: hypothetical protein OXP73_01960 [Chloroflexota bacterium]|nr:hypothetical protein [Chloroflexota bacterium]